MNKREILETLRSKGFTVRTIEDGIAASLNRNLGSIEIMMALEYKIEDHQLVKIASNEVGIICLEEELS